MAAPRKRFRFLPAALLFLLIAGVLFMTWSNNARKSVKTQRQIFAMDTLMTITMYGDGLTKDADAVLSNCTHAIQWLEDFYSPADPDSDVYRVNTANGGKIQVAAPTASLLQETLKLSQLTGGALDPTAFPATKAWGFFSGDYRVPGPEELAQLAAGIDYTKIDLAEDTQDGRDIHTVTLPAGMELDLGAVAKGDAGDSMRLFLQADGVRSALLDLGQSTIVAVGARPDGSPWRIGIQDPAGEGYLGVLELTDRAMGTSGGYQRYFEEDGTRYWHILDPDTAAPARSGLASVTVVSSSGLLCDGLSTALFVMGQEAGTAFWQAHPELDFDVIFLSDDGSIAITPGLEESFSLAKGYENREVTVLS